LISDQILGKYPRVKHFFEMHPSWTLDDALKITEDELKKLGRDDDKKHIS
jgi:hypothetical protein